MIFFLISCGKRYDCSCSYTNSSTGAGVTQSNGSTREKSLADAEQYCDKKGSDLQNDHPEYLYMDCEAK